MSDTVTILKDDFDNLCKVVAGLQVIVSMSPSMLGAAYKPWQDIHHNAGFGWKDADAYATSMLERAQAPA